MLSGCLQEVINWIHILMTSVTDCKTTNEYCPRKKREEVFTDKNGGQDIDPSKRMVDTRD